MYFIILSAIALVSVTVLAIVAIVKNYDVYIKNKLLGEIKLQSKK